MEETMKVWTMSELVQLSRSELLQLFEAISSRLAALPEGSHERQVALENLDNIRAVLNRPAFSPRRSGPKPPAP
jgi:hypothetical protein